MLSLIKKSHAPSNYGNFHNSLENLVDEFFGNTSIAFKDMDFSPKIDISEDDKSIHVMVKFSDTNEKDINVDVKDNVLTISSEKQSENEKKSKSDYSLDYSFQSFSRSFTLPKGIKTDKIEAQFKKGVLKVDIPKSHKVHSEKVKIKVE